MMDEENEIYYSDSGVKEIHYSDGGDVENLNDDQKSKNIKNKEEESVLQQSKVVGHDKTKENTKFRSSNVLDNIIDPITMNPNKRKIFYSIVAFFFICILIAIIVPLIVLRDDGDEEETTKTQIPVAVDYTTGVSLVTYYGIEASISTRLAQTKVYVDVINGLNCTSIHSITLQLPVGTRVVSLQTIERINNCTTHGQVKAIEDARETFIETAAEGLPGAYIEEQDSFTHSLQVAIPPLGKTHVELILEDLLQQRLGEIQFQIPFAPNEDVDHIEIDISVENLVSSDDPASFVLDFGPKFVVPPSSTSEPTTIKSSTSTSEPTTNQPATTGNPTTEEPTRITDDNGTTRHLQASSTSSQYVSRFHIDMPDAREHNIPKIIHGSYEPEDIPDHGYLYVDGKCFEHFFQPTSLKAMSKNLLFIVDTSVSMREDGRFSNTKSAIKQFIGTLTPDDRFIIQAFGQKGTEQLWGWAFATEQEKQAAKNFTNELKTGGSSTNLHEALVEGILRAQTASETYNDKVTIIVLITDGWASEGVTDRRQIVEDAYISNQKGKAKIFTLGFQGSADMELLDAIAVMNGGVSAPILKGYVDFAKQMQSFFKSEFGSVLLSDVSVSIEGDERTDVYGETQLTFPLLADGYEAVVRGLLNQSNADEANYPSSQLVAITTASTADGIDEWKATAAMNLPPSSTPNDSTTSLCFQSYAHARINTLRSLASLSDAGLIGTNTLKSLVTLSEPCNADEAFVDCVKHEALSLAIEGNVVVKGLTGMVTIDENNCLNFDSETEVCRDGKRADDHPTPDRDDDEDSPHGMPSHYPSGASVSDHAVFVSGILFAAFCISFMLDVF